MWVHLPATCFPGGKDASPIDSFHYSEAVQQTQEWLQSGEKIIYEAAFQYDQVMAALDILVNKKGKWYAYEVKSSTEVKDYHLTDAALQYYVMTHAGMKPEDIFLIHINNGYTRKGKLDLQQLFTIVSVKKEVLALQKEIPGNIDQYKKLLQQSREPKMDIGPHCSDPYDCEFIDYCWSHIPEVSVFTLSRLNGNKKFDLYYKGVIEYHQLPDGYSLSAAQQLQVRAHLEDYVHIETNKIRQWLRQLTYPLYFMDFETFNPAVPLYDNSKPYQQIPFQFSVHVQDKAGGKLKHVEYLGTPETDPRPEFIKQLLEATTGKGTVLAYNKTFETTRLRELKEVFPGYKKQIDGLIDRVVDLMYPFQQRWYYTASMNGSYSIKSVLPALVPELSYDGLEIAEGGSAMAAFEGLLKETDKNHIRQIRSALLKYCELDTLAMVRILEKLA